MNSFLRLLEYHGYNYDSLYLESLDFNSPSAA